MKERVRNVIVISDRLKESARTIAWAKAHPDKVKETQRRWRERNREKILEKARLYRAANPEKCRTAIAKWRAKNVNKIRECGRTYIREHWKDPEWRKKIAERKRLAYNSNPKHGEARRAANRAWQKTERGRHSKRVYEMLHRRGDRYSLPFSDWKKILESHNNRCAICGVGFSEEVKPHRDHIFPRKLGGILTKENTQALCRSCNSRKGARVLSHAA